MRPGWPRLAHRLLVGTVPGWPRLWPHWPHHEWPGVANLLIQCISLHFVAFLVVVGLGFTPLGVNPHPHPRLLPSREKGFARIRGNDGCFRLNDAYNQCKGWGGDGAMGSCRWFGVWVWGQGQGQGCEVPACAGTTDASRSLNSYRQLMPLARCKAANVLDYLAHLLLGDGRHRRHVAEEPVVGRDALPHGALEGGVSVVARPIDGAYERRAALSEPAAFAPWQPAQFTANSCSPPSA